MTSRNKFSHLPYRSILLVTLVIFCGLAISAPLATQAGTVNLEVGIGSNTATQGSSYYIGMVYRFAAAIVGVVAVVMIIVGGVQYSTSAGNQAALGSAKETITSAIIGLVIVLMSYLILGVFSERFTNLTEPTLDNIVIDETDTNTPPERHLICGGVGGIPTCGYALGTTADDPRCVGPGKGEGTSCASTPSDCTQYTSSAECNMNAMCEWCDSYGGSVCVAQNTCAARKKDRCNSATTCGPSVSCGANPSSSACQTEQNDYKQRQCAACPAVTLKNGGPTGKLICCFWP